jgi:4-alpha-glucanotransferase
VRPDAPLLALAEHCGIQLRFDGSDGHAHAADEDVLLALLQAWGVECTGNEEAGRRLHDLEIEAAQRTMEPVLVHRVGRASSHAVTLPGPVTPDQVECTLTLDTGDVRRLPLSALTVGSAAGGTVGGRTYQVHRFDLERTGPALPIGYHHAHLDGPGIDAGALVVCAPRCPTAPRNWGLFMPLHAVRSESDWGIGSYADLASLGQWAAGHGASMVGSLPLYPVLTDPPIDPSPYLPASKLAYNELFIDLTSVPELAGAPEVTALLSSDRFRQRIGQAHQATTVPYDEVAAMKHEVLRLLSTSLLAHQSTRRTAFMAFGEQHPELAAYSHFRSAHPGDGTADYHTFLYGQWVASEQLAAAERSIDLYADLPIGVHPDGFDPHYFPETFVTSVHGGAPPDLFFSGGQDWSFPPLHPERMRRDGYAYLRATLRRACRHADVLRIDHVMGIHRLYWIPEGFDAAHGAYVHARSDEVRAIISLEAQLSGTVIVGEDLGTVPPEVRHDMAEDHMLRSWVMQFESTPAQPLVDPPATSLASWGTHDLPRFLAYFDGDDIGRQVTEGWISAREGRRQHKERRQWRAAVTKALGVATDDGNATFTGCLEWMATSRADLVLIDLEELWGERVAHNVPGTGTERGNWSRRGALTLEELRADHELGDRLRAIDRSRRLPLHPLIAGVGAEVPS